MPYDRGGNQLVPFSPPLGAGADLLKMFMQFLQPPFQQQVATLTICGKKERALKRATTFHDDDTPPEMGWTEPSVDLREKRFPQRTEPSVDLPEQRVPQRTQPSAAGKGNSKRVSEATAVVIAAIKRKRAEKAEGKKAEEKEKKAEEKAEADEGIPKRQKKKMAPLDTPCPNKRKQLDEHTPQKETPQKKAKTSADTLKKGDSPAKPAELPIESRIYGTEKGKIVNEASRSNWRVRMHGNTSKSFSYKAYGSDEKAFTAAVAYLDSL